MRHSYSTLATLSECQAKFAFRYIEKLEPEQGGSPAMIVGTWLHFLIAVEGIRRGTASGTLLRVPESLKGADGTYYPKPASEPAEGGSGSFSGPHGSYSLDAEGVATCVAEWERTADPEFTAAIAQKIGMTLADFIPSFWQRYTRTHSEDLMNEDVLLVEHGWSRDIEGKTLQGVVDSVVHDRSKDLVVVRDLKTQQSLSGYDDRLMDLTGAQLQLQTWGVAPLLAEHGYLPRAVAYDRACYVAPTWPKMTQKGALSATTKLFDTATYMAFCTDSGQEPDQTVLDRCAEYEAAGTWFRRRRIPVHTKAVERHVNAMLVMARQAETITTETAMPIPGRHCGFCEMSSICRQTLYQGLPDPLVPEDYGLRRA